MTSPQPGEIEVEDRLERRIRKPVDGLRCTLSCIEIVALALGMFGVAEFLKNVSELNPKLKDTQFADYHGHGWNFRAIFKRDRKGNLLDDANNIIPANDPEKFKKAVHLDSIHVDFGMQCVDCHFGQDNHGSDSPSAKNSAWPPRPRQNEKRRDHRHEQKDVI